MTRARSDRARAGVRAEGGSARDRLMLPAAEPGTWIRASDADSCPRRGFSRSVGDCAVYTTADLRRSGWKMFGFNWIHS